MFAIIFFTTLAVVFGIYFYANSINEKFTDEQLKKFEQGYNNWWK